MSRAQTIKILALTLALGAASCGGPPPSGPEIVWPEAPDRAQVRFVSAFHGSQDLHRGFFGRVKDFLFGKAASMAISKPYGVAFDGKANLYVAETASKGVLVYDLDGGTAKFLKKISERKSLLEPVYVILDDQGRIYVSDTELRRVVVFNADLSFSHYIGSPQQLEAPVGMAFDARNQRLYVVDTRGHCVKVFSQDGTLIQTIGRRGDQRGEFYYPTTLAVGPDGKLYIVDSFHFAVQVFDSSGAYLYSFGPTESGPGRMARPRDIALDALGRLYITDAARNNVQVYDSVGSPLLAFGQTGVAKGEFQLPAGIFISKDKRIYVADSINRRVQIFEYITDATREGSNHE